MRVVALGIVALTALVVLFFAAVFFFFGMTDADAEHVSQRHSEQADTEVDISGDPLAQETCTPLTPPPNIPPALAYAIRVEECRSTEYTSYPIRPIEQCPAETPPPTEAVAPGFVRSDACPDP